MSALVTDQALAERFGIDVDHLHRLRKRNHWPCVKFGRQDFRFTEEQVDQIVQMQTVAQAAPVSLAVAGQTERSRRRS